MKSKTFWLVGAAAVWCLAVTAAVAEGTKEERAAACAKEAKVLKGEEREAAINACLKAGNGTSASNGHGHSQQNKMKYCNVEAGKKELRGDERRAFMSSCLKG